MTVNLDEDLNHVFKVLINSEWGEELSNYTNPESLLAAIRVLFQTFPEKCDENGIFFNKIFDNINVNYFKTKMNDALVKNNEFSAKIYQNRLEEYLESRGLTKKSAKETKMSKLFPCTGNLEDFNDNLNTANHGQNSWDRDKSNGKSNTTKVSNQPASDHNYGVFKNPNKPKLWSNAYRMLEETMKNNDHLSSVSTQKFSDCGKQPIWSNAFKLLKESMRNDNSSVASLQSSNLRRNTLLANNICMNNENFDNASIKSRSTLPKKTLWANAFKLLNEAMGVSNAANSGGVLAADASSATSVPKNKIWSSAFRKLDSLNPSLYSQSQQQKSNSELKSNLSKVELSSEIFPNSAQTKHSSLKSQTSVEKQSLWRNAMSRNKTIGLQDPTLKTDFNNMRALTRQSETLDNQMYSFKSINETKEGASNQNQRILNVKSSNRSGNLVKANEHSKYFNSSEKIEKVENNVTKKKSNNIKNMSIEDLDCTPIRSSKRLRRVGAESEEKLGFPKTTCSKLDSSTPLNSVGKRKFSKKNLNCSTPLNSKVRQKRKRSLSLAEMNESLRPHAKRFRDTSKEQTMVKVKLSRRKVRSLKNSTFNSTNVTDRSCDTNISTPTSTLTNRVGKMRILYKRNLGI